MTDEELVAKSDRIFHNHGDVLIKVFSVLVALLLLGLWFLSTSKWNLGNQVPLNGVLEVVR